MEYLGIDPGKSGGIAILLPSGPVVCKLSHTEHDIAEWLMTHATLNTVATLERVHAMPKQGVSSTFTFGMNYGFIQGILTALHIPYKLVTPQTWQKQMSCLSKGDKNITKSAAQRLFPRLKITHATADALLIAEYGRKYLWQ